MKETTGISEEALKQETEKKSTGIGFLFFMVAGIGAVFIYFNHEIDPNYGMYLPTLVVIGYSGAVSHVLKQIKDREQAEHQIDSVYFLGFLFTLVSLLFFFSGFSKISGTSGIPDLNGPAESIFRYLGISVSTSIAGVLFRSILRGSYLARRSAKRFETGIDPDASPEDKSEQLLEAIAESLAPMREYLSERNEKRQLLSLQEDAYLASLERFIEATENFSSRLDSFRQLLGKQLESFSDSLAESEEGMRRMSEIHRALSGSAEEMERFATGTGELNVVLDGLLEILELKVEKVV